MRTSQSAINVAQVLSTVALLATVAGALTACMQKKPGTQMNVCACACRQETDTTVTIANKIFYSSGECSFFEGASCEVGVTTSSGSYTVSGNWEGCKAHGKAWVQTLNTPDEIPTVAVAPDDIRPPPPPPRQ